MLESRTTTEQIIASAIKVHSTLGPGLLESVYEHCLAYELTSRGLAIERQKPIAIQYASQTLDAGFRADLVVEQRVIVELKCVDKLAPIHEAQLLTYLRLSGIKVGLLFNFNQLRVTEGMIRRVL